MPTAAALRGDPWRGQQPEAEGQWPQKCPAEHHSLTDVPHTPLSRTAVLRQLPGFVCSAEEPGLGLLSSNTNHGDTKGRDGSNRPFQDLDSDDLSGCLPSQNIL